MNLFSRILTVPFVLAASFCFGGDDIDFARGLARDGYVQQAEEMCRKIEAGTDEQEKSAVPLVRAEIAARRAAAAATPAEARKELARGAAALDAFVEANPGHRRLGEARMQAGLMRRQVGEIAEQEFAEGVAEAGTQGREELDRGLKNFDAAAAVAKAARHAMVAAGKDARALEDVDGQIAEAAYQMARCLHLRARLAGDDADRTKRLQAALEAFVNLEFDYGETGLVQEASLTWALVLRDLGRPSEAVNRFDVAWKVTAPWREKLVNGPLPAWEREVAERAACGKAETLTANGDPAAALATVEALLALVPNAAQDRSGFLAELEKGEALAALGRRREAANLAVAMMQRAPSAALKEIAGKRLLKWGGAGAPAARRLLAGAAFGANNWAQAWSEYRAVLAEEGPDAELLWRLAVCAEHLERPWEAAVLYETLAVDYPDAPNAPDAAFRAAQLWNQFASRAGDASRWERDQVDRMLRLLVTRWPSDPNAKNALYLVADAAFERGEYDSAARDFAGVPKESNLRVQALFMAARAQLRLAEAAWAKDKAATKPFSEAETLLRQAIEEGLAQGAARAAIVASARLSLASTLLHEQAPRPAEAIRVLESLGGGMPAEQERRAAELTVRARIANGEPAKAAEAAEGMAKRFRAEASTAKACRQAAAACDAAAEAGGTDAAALREAAIARYADALECALAAKTPAAGLDASAVADRVLQLALALNGIADDASIDDTPAALPCPGALRNAARVARAAGESPGLPAGWSADFRLGRALGFVGDLEGARDAFGRIVEDAGLVRNGKFNAAAIQGKAWLLAAYEELGMAHLRLGAGAQLDAAGAVFGNLVAECAVESGPWWRGKVGALRVLVARGKPGDFEMARLGLDDLLSNHPKLDEGKFGISRKVEALKKKLDSRK